MKIAITHDYLLQYGGAERVVASWAHHLPSSSIHSLAYNPTATFDVFARRSINSRITNSYVQSKIEFLLPALPFLASQVQVKEGDVALVSTSGWAHHFHYEMPTLAYVHSPARWLYAASDYSKKLSPLGRLGLGVSSAFLKSQDRPAMQRMTKVISNSAVTKERIYRAYGLDAQVIHPPVEAIRAQPEAPTAVLPEQFTLVVSRNRGYKNVELAVKASHHAQLPCVVVGMGTEEYDSAEEGVYGLGRVSDAELKWLYQAAQVLIGSAHEDFGLTVLEASLEGTPSAVIPAGGYLETVSEGVSGSFAESESAAHLGAAIVSAAAMRRDSCRTWGEKFSTLNHMHQLHRVLNSM